MAEKHPRSVTGLLGPLIAPKNRTEEESSPLRIAGWALFLASLAAICHILLPLKLTNVEWEFEIMGRLADNALLPVLGIALVLHRRPVIVSEWHLLAFRCATVALLCFSLLYIGLIPLAVRHTGSLLAIVETRMQAARQITDDQGRDIEAAIASARDLSHLQVLGMAINLTPDMARRRVNFPAEGVEELREWLKSSSATLRRRSLEEAIARFEADKAALLKEGIKISALAGIAGLFAALLFFQQSEIFRKHVPCLDGLPA